jgi:hypothetical protein
VPVVVSVAIARSVYSFELLYRQRHIGMRSRCARASERKLDRAGERNLVERRELEQ